MPGNASAPSTGPQQASDPKELSKDRLRWRRAELGGKLVFPSGPRKDVVDTLRDARNVRTVDATIKKFLKTYADAKTPRAVETRLELLFDSALAYSD